jgi:hypothetical protein
MIQGFVGEFSSPSVGAERGDQPLVDPGKTDLRESPGSAADGYDCVAVRDNRIPKMIKASGNGDIDKGLAAEGSDPGKMPIVSPAQ